LEENLQVHIGSAELARLLEQCRCQDEAATRTLEGHPHFAECSACREQFEELVLLDRELKIAQMESIKPIRTAQADCPDEGIWREIAAGLTASAQTLSCVEHASGCSYCGPLLHAAVAELGGLGQTLSDAERKYIATLQSANPDWQQRLSSRISGVPLSESHQTSKTTRPRITWLSLTRPGVARFAMAGGSLLAIIAVASWVIVHRTQPATADRLLARAYTEQRTLELRIAGAEYAPLRISRGPQASFSSRSEALLKAEALISTELRSHPSDATWLQAKAEADLLEGKYDAAVDSLRRAVQLDPHSPAILTDLGTAYFQRAQQEDKKDDLGAAYEYLSQALKFRPDDPVALFNRAIVSEHQFLYHQAIEDWDHYLRVEPASQWAGEARNHLNSVQEILKRHGNMAPLLSPAAVVAAAATPSGGSESASGASKIDQRIEEYLQEAVRSWLPQAFPETRASANPDVSQALFFLAELTRQRHSDAWLADLLQGSSAARFPRAVTALARAVTANRGGDYEVARQQGELAEQLFQGSNNQAGALRAEFEQAYSEQMTRRTQECRQDSNRAFAQSEVRRYSWLQVQLGLEKAVCSLLGKDDWGADERFSRRAMGRAKEAHFDGLYVRALYFVADDQVRNGDLSEGLKSAVVGLERYWSTPIPSFLAYNLYDLIASLPEFAATRQHLVMAACREATAVVESGENLPVRAWAHSFAAQAAVSADEPEIAEQQYAEAARLFALAPKTEAIRSYILWHEIHMAGVEAHLGRLESGIARLTRIQDQVRQRSDTSLEETFYATLGDLELHSHHAVQAEEVLRPALESVEQRLSSLNSEKDRIAWSREAAPVYLGLAEAELVQGHAEASLGYFELYLGATNRSGGRNQNGIRVHNTRPDPAWLTSPSPLLSGRTVLAYAALPDGLAIWTYDNRGLNAQWIPQSNQELQVVAARFYELASDPRSELTALRRDSQSLYRSLIAPVEQRLDPGRTIVIEADGWLAQVPFEALLDSSGHYLIERAPIVRSLGQSMDASLHADVLISKNLNALIVGSAASSQTEGLVPLPDVLAEAEAVARDFRSPNILRGSDITLAAVENDLHAAAVFHFTGHSLSRPNGGGLMLTATNAQKKEPILLGADKLRQLDLRNLQLAVLSTCNTEYGRDGAEDFNSIAEALQRAGVPHVVASRWAVDSVETQRFVEDFYTSALSGKPVSEAVREASRRMMDDSRTSHPYYWSAFSAYGRP
jgi:CHAT domain-containing protein/cytochrome c-type biogenesis protein CcmH/NrfG